MWLNTGTEGDFYAVQIYRVYKKPHEDFQKTHSFVADDLRYVAAVAETCQSWILSNPIGTAENLDEYIPPVQAGLRPRLPDEDEIDYDTGPEEYSTYPWEL